MSEYAYEFFAEPTEEPVWMWYRTHKTIGYGTKCGTPGTAVFLQNSQKFRVFVRKSHRTDTSVGYLYALLAEPTYQ